MLENNKCILVYGLSNEEIKKIESLNHKIIEVTPDMCRMTIKDILNGLKILLVNEAPIKEKVIIYNNFPEKEMSTTIKETRAIVKNGILAVVTPTSIEWEVNYLIEHLIEEREFYLKNREG